ncbi:MAG: NAD(P)/FAD-dependent oxidoreductase [Chloroflexota bacterium]|nr:NAD(P)/FAD-dependent oxidoreductase [Chloroflexota bacterium]
MSESIASLGPLDNGARIVIIGGGPGGVGTALALRQLARQMGREIQITLFEGKVFAGEQHFNQCVGVLSPPIDTILVDLLGVPFPRHLVQREITGYLLHSDDRAILLESGDPPAYSVRRVQFDDYMLEQARACGIRVITSRVTDLEFHADRVIVYSESGNSEADVVVGAFGSDDGTAVVFQRATDYRAPRFLSSIVTKIHPRPEFMDAFGNHIHAFLPSTRGIEFGAVTPKGNHLTMNIAGARVDAAMMDRFLRSPAVQSVLPCLDDGQGENDLAFFKGRFPASQARAFSGDRYVIVGDAAGMVRPFKGKGVNSAMLTGWWAAQTMMNAGISARAFREYHQACYDITRDLPYGKAMRAVALSISRWHLLDTVIALAEQDARLRHALFGAVSAHQTYREIVQSMLDARWLARMAFRLAALPFRK